MGNMQRNKGAGFEREIAAYLQQRFGHGAKRILGQARDSGNDVDFGPLVLEMKRRKRLTTLETWLDQCTRAVAGKGVSSFGRRIPVVVARADNGEALAILTLDSLLHLSTPVIQTWLDRQHAEHDTHVPRLEEVL